MSRRDDSPLAGAERYLWKRYKESAKKTELRKYYLEGWELLRYFQDVMLGSSSWGNSWPHGGDQNALFRGACAHDGCPKPVKCLINQVRIPDEEDEWCDLPDAPRLYCHEHGYEFAYGKPWVPPPPEMRRVMNVLLHPEENGAPVKAHTCNSCGEEYLYCDWFTVIAGSCNKCMKKQWMADDD